MNNFPIAPPAASTHAAGVDALFFVLIALALVFTGIVAGMIFFLAYRYRRGNKVDRSRPPSHSTFLEVTWSVIPLILGLGVFVWGAKLFANVYTPPADAMEITAIGKQWMWHLQHANGVRENNELHVPVGKPVKLTMISQDVIHSFFVPAFRIKRDVIPGRYSTVWFEPTKPGRYYLFCAEYCGTAHSEMGGYITVMEPAEFQQWLSDNSNGTKVATTQKTMVEAGKEIYEQLNCGSCHGLVDGPKGPTLVNIYNTQRKLTTGKYAKADDAYLRESILNPNLQITAGYEGVMPVYNNQLTEDKVLQLIAYIKTLSPANPGKPGMDTGASTNGSAPRSTPPAGSNGTPPVMTPNGTTPAPAPTTPIPTPSNPPGPANAAPNRDAGNGNGGM